MPCALGRAGLGRAYLIVHIYPSPVARVCRVRVDRVRHAVCVGVGGLGEWWYGGWGRDVVWGAVDGAGWVVRRVRGCVCVGGASFCYDYPSS